MPCAQRASLVTCCCAIVVPLGLAGWGLHLPEHTSECVWAVSCDGGGRAANNCTSYLPQSRTIVRFSHELDESHLKTHRI